MAEVKKFLFDLDFDAGAAAAERPEEPSFSAEELEAARQAAYAEGEAVGRAAARQETEAAIAALLEQAAGQLQNLMAETQAAQRDMTHSAARIGHAVGTALARELMAAHPLAEIEAMLRECMSELREEPRLVIRTHETRLDSIREPMERLKASAGFTGDIVIVADDALSPDSCRLEWADGGAELNTDDIRTAVDDAVNRFLSMDTDTDDLSEERIDEHRTAPMADDITDGVTDHG